MSCCNTNCSVPALTQAGKSPIPSLSGSSGLKHCIRMPKLHYTIVTLALNEPASTPRAMAESEHNRQVKAYEERNGDWNCTGHHLPFPSTLLKQILQPGPGWCCRQGKVHTRPTQCHSSSFPLENQETTRKHISDAAPVEEHLDLQGMSIAGCSSMG